MRKLSKIIATIVFGYIFISSFYFIMISVNDIPDINLPFVSAWIFCALSAWFINYMWNE